MAKSRAIYRPDEFARGKRERKRLSAAAEGVVITQPTTSTTALVSVSASECTARLARDDDKRLGQQQTQHQYSASTPWDFGVAVTLDEVVRTRLLDQEQRELDQLPTPNSLPRPPSHQRPPPHPPRRCRRRRLFCRHRQPALSPPTRLTCNPREGFLRRPPTHPARRLKHLPPLLVLNTLSARSGPRRSSLAGTSSSPTITAAARPSPGRGRPPLRSNGCKPRARSLEPRRRG